jgi:hypothetical protein
MAEQDSAALSAPESMDDSTGPELEGFEIGEDGYVEPVWAGAEEELPEHPDAISGESSSDTPAQDQPADGGAFEGRYNELRSFHDRTVTQAQSALQNQHARIQWLEQQLQARGGAVPEQRQQPAEDVDLLEVLTDPEKGQAYLNEQIARGIEQGLTNHPVVVRQQMREELIDMASRYPDFVEMRPHIHEFYAIPSNGGVPFEQAYHFVKRMRNGAAPAAASRPPQETPGARAESAASTKVPLTGLQARAARLRTEQGVGGSAGAAPERKPVTSFREAFDRAVSGG